MSGFPSDNRETFEAASIAAIASEAADDAMQQQKEYEQQQEQQPLLEEQADSSFYSPTSSAYQTPASALSLASSTGRGSEIFATPAGSLAAGGLSARSSTDGTGSSPARPAPPAAAAGSLSGGPMSLGTEGVGDAANTRLVTAPLDKTEGRVSTADAGSASEVVRGQLSEGMGGGVKVYVGEPGLAAGFDGLPAGTSMEGAVEAANELADQVEADRREEMAGKMLTPLGRGGLGSPAYWTMDQGM
jgi:hypothetical protein